MAKLKVGTHGEIVIPKKIRDALGLVRGRKVVFKLKGSVLELQAEERDVIKEMEEDAKRYGSDVSKWKMGDELYEELADEGF